MILFMHVIVTPLQLLLSLVLFRIKIRSTSQLLVKSLLLPINTLMLSLSNYKKKSKLYNRLEEDQNTIGLNFGSKEEDYS